MRLPFSDRPDAGRQLADLLRDSASERDGIVLGLPRGGVPVAAEVAAALNLPLDVFVVRKLGIPGQPEFAMGAVASGGVRVLNQQLLQELEIPQEWVETATTVERLELERREREYRLGRPFPDLRGKTVILVDDGAATGSTMLAAIRALRRHGPALIIAAAPVMSESAWYELSWAADRCEAVAVPEPFRAVGTWYRDFQQTTDDEVRSALERAAARQAAEPATEVEGPYAARS